MKPMGPHCEIKSSVFGTTPLPWRIAISRQMKSSTVLSYFSSLESPRPRSREILRASYPTASSEYELRSIDKQAFVAEWWPLEWQHSCGKLNVDNVILLLINLGFTKKASLLTSVLLGFVTVSLQADNPVAYKQVARPPLVFWGICFYSAIDMWANVYQNRPRDCTFN
jgi:hypothetical protein